MPRAFSSGALAIGSKATNCTFGLCFANTFVIAAVNVVLPWSTCPIVPMFTCGLERSNFSFDILLSPCLLDQLKRKGTDRVGPVPTPTPLFCNPLDLCNDLFSNILRRLLVTLEVHGLGCAALRRRPQVGRVTKHF